MKDDEKGKKKREELLDNLGLGIGEEEEETIDIQRVGDKRGYIAQVTVDEVRDLYGTLPEYLKTNHGPGEYIVTVRSAKGKPTTQRMRIAGESVDEDGQQQPLGMEGPDSATMAMVIQLQVENAKLQAEREASQGAEKTQLWGQIAQYVIPIVESLLQGMKGNQQQDIVAVIKSATESIKELAEAKQILAAPVQNEGGGDVASIIGAIAQTLQGMSANRQPMPQVPPPMVQQSKGIK